MGNVVQEKKIYISISKECHKKLKILSIQKDASLQDVAKEVLEKVMSNKKYDLDVSVLDS